MNNIAQIRKGFTLIELMIVIAIISILTAIALPMYNDYVARTQLSEAYGLLSGMKAPMEEAAISVYSANNINISQICNNNQAWYADSQRSGKYVDRIEVSRGSNNKECKITAILRNTDISSNLKNAKVAMQFDAEKGTWKCGTILDPSIRRDIKNIAHADCNEPNGLF